MLVLLWACRPASFGAAVHESIRSWKPRSSAWYGAATGLGFLLLSVSVLCGEPSLYFSLQGKGPPPVRILGGPSDVGRAAPNSLQIAKVVVTNQSAQPVEIVGGGVSCGCMTLNSIPMTIPPRQSVTLQVQIRVPMDAGPFKKSFAYFLRHPRQFRVVGAVQGTVTAAAPILASRLASATGLIRGSFRPVVDASSVVFAPTARYPIAQGAAFEPAHFLAAERRKVIAPGVSLGNHGMFSDEAPAGRHDTRQIDCVAPSGALRIQSPTFPGLTPRAITCRPIRDSKCATSKSAALKRAVIVVGQRGKADVLARSNDFQFGDKAQRWWRFHAERPFVQPSTEPGFS